MAIRSLYREDGCAVERLDSGGGMSRVPGFLDSLRARFYHRRTRKIAHKVFRMLTLEARTMFFTRACLSREIRRGILLLAALALPLMAATVRADEPAGNV